MSSARRTFTPFPTRRALSPFQIALETGLEHLRQRRFVQAISALDQAVGFKPRDVAALSQLGLALSGAGRVDEARAMFDRGLAEAPHDAGLHFHRGNALLAQSREAEAIAAFDAALALRADFPEALTNRGNALRLLGRNAEALENYDQALALRPRLAEALISKATLLDQTGRRTEALAALDRLLCVDKSSAQGYLARADLQKRLGRPQLAARDYALATRADPNNAVVHVLLGDHLAELGRCDEAERSYARAIAVEPASAEAHDRLGCALVQLGRFDEARGAHDKAVALGPDKPGFYFNLVDVSKLDAADPRFLTMLDMAKDVRSLTTESEILLRFALFKAFSDQGDLKQAFHQLTLGNARKRATITYDEQASQVDMKTVRSLFSARLLGDHRGHGHDSKVPVFVVGLPRSGSTLVEQILSSHPGVHGAGEVPDFVDAAVEIVGDTLRDLRVDGDRPDELRDQLRRIGARYVERIEARSGGAERVVDKMLDNFRFVGLIHLALPNAHIVHIRRDPLDTAFSCYSRLFSSNIPYAYDLGELGRHYRAYDRLMRHWRAVIPAETLLEVQYEELIADPETTAHRMIEHCGLPWNDACLAFHRNPRPVRTASAVQVRKPIYRDGVGAATKFADGLAPLIAALGDSAPAHVRQPASLQTLWSRIRSLGDRFPRGA